MTGALRLPPLNHQRLDRRPSVDCGRARRSEIGHPDARIGPTTLAERAAPRSHAARGRVREDFSYYQRYVITLQMAIKVLWSRS